VTVYGNGFLAYHLEVRVAAGQALATKALVHDWEDDFRQHGTWPGFPEALIERLATVPGVEAVVCEGPQSSVLIPLRMVKGLTGQAAILSTVLGEGPISAAAERQLAEWGVEVRPSRRLVAVDLPLEFSFRDPAGTDASLRLYPAKRASYRAALAALPVLPDHLVLNRHTQGLRGLAEQVAGQGGCVSFRPRELGRHDRLEDYLALLPYTQQLVLSNRHDVLRQFVRHASIAVPRGWPANAAALSDPSARHLAAWLFEHLPATALVVFNHYPTGGSAFYRQAGEPVVVSEPAGYDTASRAARIQGALLGAALAPGYDLLIAQGGVAWEQACIHVVKTAFSGTEQRPWQYPEGVRL
jgi:hypothetical protein